MSIKRLSVNYADNYLVYSLKQNKMPNFKLWDIKYYYHIHCQKQKVLGNYPVSYNTFTARLKKMNLHDAIYTPRVESQVRDKKLKHTIQDDIRREQINKNENIQILDFKHMEMVEKRSKPRKTGKIQMPKPKKTLFQKIISWIKKK